MAALVSVRVLAGSPCGLLIDLAVRTASIQGPQVLGAAREKRVAVVIALAANRDCITVAVRKGGAQKAR